VGICSTTYGDLVCRGCKRFSHEIVQWNAFEDDQRQAVWHRLLELRRGAVERWLRILDAQRLRKASDELRIAPPGAAAEDEFELAYLAYEVLRRLAPRGVELAVLGLEAARPSAHEDAAAVLRAIDAEFYTRSVAQYERSYHTVAE
jgi:predicted Fe-S protein YdhL (DUF1289 family)